MPLSLAVIFLNIFQILSGNIFSLKKRRQINIKSWRKKIILDFFFNFWKKINENTVGQKFSNTISMMLMAVTIDNMKKYFSSKDLELIFLNFANKIWFSNKMPCCLIIMRIIYINYLRERKV